MKNQEDVTVRQGDLLFIRIDSPMLKNKKLPESTKKQNDGVIARGEATGHVHQLHHGELLLDGTEQFVVANEGCEVTHQEHGTAALWGLSTPTVNTWVVRRQREYLPQGARNVAD